MEGRPDHRRGGLSAIGTLVCRRSRYIKLIHLPGRCTAEELVVGIHQTLAELPHSVRLTLTWDQGSEMAGHDQIAALFGEGVFFAHAGKPWQRPTNENSNGVLRQYFPQGQRPARALRRTPTPRRRATQHPTTEDARVGSTRPDPCRFASLIPTFVLRHRLESALELACRQGVRFRLPLTTRASGPVAGQDPRLARLASCALRRGTLGSACPRPHRATRARRSA